MVDYITMEKQTTKRRFKGIWIPARLWLAKELSIFEKSMLAEIDSLSVEDCCFASNEYLAVFFGISQRRVQQVLQKLIEKNLVERDITREKSKKGGDRFLRLTDKFYQKYGDEGMKEISPPGMKKVSPQGRKKFHPRHERSFTPGVKEISPLLYKVDNKVDNKDYNKDEIRENSSQDLSKAAKLLRRFGFSDLASAKLIETYSAGQIIVVVQNGLAKEAHGGFTLQAGYIVTALNRSAKEGKIVTDTAAVKKIREKIENKNKKFQPKSDRQIQENKKRQLKALGVA